MYITSRITCVIGFLFVFVGENVIASQVLVTQPDFADGTTLTADSLNTRIGPLAPAINDNDGRVTINETKLQNILSLTCGTNTFVNSISTDGTLSCSQPAISGGDVTDVTAGPGILVTSPTGPAPSVAIDPTFIQRRITGANGSCGTGFAIRLVNQDGTVACESVGVSAGGDITDVNAGFGVSVTSPTGPAPTIDIDTTVMQQRVSGVNGSCSVGSAIRAINEDGSVECENIVTTGINFNALIGDTFLSTVTTDLISVNLTAPAAGFVTVSFTANYQIIHKVGTDDLMEFDISNSATAGIDPNTRHRVFIGNLTFDTAVLASVTLQKVFPVTTGVATYHVYANSSRFTASTEVKVINPNIQVTFVPKKY